MTKTLQNLVLAIACAAALSACGGGTSSTEGCTADAECSNGLYCDTVEKACKCRTDDACQSAFGSGFECNSFGQCQPRPPCRGNQDCEPGEICNSSDPSGGKCISGAQCGSTVHCEFGQYCDPQTLACVDGCRNTGDCQLGDICVAGSCVDGACSVCPTSPDPDPSYCDYGETCTTGGQCNPHAAQGSLCSDCTLSGACGSDMICLVDDLGGGNANYCAPTCDTSLDCPNGYGSCNGINIVTTQCNSDSDCTNGGVCLGSAEGNTSFCSCVSNVDCPADMCFFGQCLSIPGISCQTDADCSTSCEPQDAGNGESVGLCMTNIKACGKDEGVTCTELQSGRSDCNNF